MLRIEDLYVRFPDNGSGKEVTAVCGVRLNLAKGRTLAVVGESGSGKSVMGMSICSLLPHNAVISGSIRLDGMELLGLARRNMRALRGSRIAFVPQSAGLSLNPTMRCLRQVSEVFVKRRGIKAKAAKHAAQDLLSRMGLMDRDKRRHPHMLSGGMRQRVLVGIGLSGAPDLLIADEPTKGLDMARQRDVQTLFARIREENPAMTVLLITHDLDLAESLADEVAVMYGGAIAEQAPCAKFFGFPAHPYSRGLLAALPKRGLTPLPGRPLAPLQRPKGCVFHPRCTAADEQCRTYNPPLRDTGERSVSCWRHV
ncbi:MAG: ABC transporter ATP-binding protein [Desulfovibrio sp.]|nr:MAG: ABC transporter ATP-binding protein [Desulfovibrio sp.]